MISISLPQVSFLPLLLALADDLLNLLDVATVGALPDGGELLFAEYRLVKFDLLHNLVEVIF